MNMNIYMNTIKNISVSISFKNVYIEMIMMVMMMKMIVTTFILF